MFFVSNFNSYFTIKQNQKSGQIDLYIQIDLYKISHFVYVKLMQEAYT